jgi:hypothetical protein
MKELNPGFNGKLSGRDGSSPPTVEQGVVTVVHFEPTWVTDISPLRAFPGLADINVGGAGARGRGKIQDLSPLTGMQLRAISIYTTSVSDLSPLRGMSLNYLECSDTMVSDLSPLAGMPLKQLFLAKTRITDLSPLESCTQLERLRLKGTDVSASQIAALRKKLPMCTIAWDEPSTPTQ